MSKDVDENLIEATIRRIQEQNTGDQQAAKPVDDDAEDAIQATIRRVQAQTQEAETPAHASGIEETPEGEYASASMDRIRDTIRRTQAQAAAHALPDEEPVTAHPPVKEDPIESTIRRVQAQAAANAVATEATAAAGLTTLDLATDQSRTPEDEDPIEATIRRVQAQAAAQSEATPTSTEQDDHADEEDPIAATIRRVAAAKAARANEEWDEEEAVAEIVPRSIDPVEAAIRVAETDTPVELPLSAASSLGSNPVDGDARPEPTPWPGRDERMLGEAATWEVAARRLEQGLQDAQREVRALSARLDVLLSSAPALTVVAPTTPRPDAEEWDDSPQVSRVQFGAPPRQPIMRDPSPQTATAAELVQEPVREVEKPAATAPRLRAIDAEGNLGDHLPRQYRITVEDKRRGVDLVPLHRAMQSLSNMKDMSLLSYSNGVAIVLVESVGAIDPEALRLAVARAMSREAKIEVHNEQTMVVKIQED